MNTEQQIPEDFAPAWLRVRERLKATLGPAQFQFWLDPIWLVSADTQRVVLVARTSFGRDQAAKLYGDLIASLIRREAPSLGPVEFIVAARPSPAIGGTIMVRRSDSPSDSRTSQLVAGSIPLNKNYTFETFVTGRPNEIAVAEARFAAESDTPIANVLFLFGGTGLGKSHLMHAIAWRILERDPTKKILHITAEWFLGKFVAAIKGGETEAFKTLIRNVDVLLADDLHFIIGKSATAEEFLHTFDALIAANKQLVLTADRSPVLLDELSDPIRSRLSKGASVEIAPSDFELRLAILKSKADRLTRERPNFAIGGEALRFMAQRINANTRQLEGALNRVACHMNDRGDPTLSDLQRCLADFLKMYDRRVTIEEIKSRTASFFGLKVSDLESQSRARDIVRPRQVGMYLARLMTSRALPEIARRFAKKDHTTVLHAVKAVKANMLRDPEFAAKVDELRRSIRDWPIDPSFQPPRRSPSTPTPPAERHD